MTGTATDMVRRAAAGHPLGVRRRLAWRDIRLHSRNNRFTLLPQDRSWLFVEGEVEDVQIVRASLRLQGAERWLPPSAFVLRVPGVVQASTPSSADSRANMATV